MSEMYIPNQVCTYTSIQFFVLSSPTHVYACGPEQEPLTALSAKCIPNLTVFTSDFCGAKHGNWNSVKDAPEFGTPSTAGKTAYRKITAEYASQILGVQVP